MKRILAGFGLALLFTAVAAIAQEARVLMISGNGSAMVTIGGREVAATKDLALPVDAVIRTTTQEVYIQVIEGVVASVKPNSVVRVDTLAGPAPRLELRQGSVVSQLDKKRLAGRTYGVKAGNGVAAARGTAFTVSLTGGLRITATADRVEFTTASGRLITVQAGMVSVTEPGATEPGVAVPLAQAAATDPQVASTLQEAVQSISTVVQNNLGGISSESATSIISQVVAVASGVLPNQAASFAAQAVTAVTAPGSATATSPDAAAIAAAAVTSSAVRAAPSQAAQIAGAAAQASPENAGAITAAALQSAPSESSGAIVDQVANSTGQSPSNVRNSSDAAKPQADQGVQRSNEALDNVVLPQPPAPLPPTPTPPTEGDTGTPQTPIEPTINSSPNV